MHSFKHKKQEVPVYKFSVVTKPLTVNSKCKYKRKIKLRYKRNIQESACVEMQKYKIYTPVKESDIEVEIYWSTKLSMGIRADVDNIIKPILDVLEGIVYLNDRQVRCVTSCLFDKNRQLLMSGRVEDAARLLFSHNKNVVYIFIYSDSRLGEIGGAKVVEGKRQREYFRKFPKFRTIRTSRTITTF
ncbi:MAG: hypothetical protein ACD_63C00068G0001 [uncultured bacterium]|nr:MAG: hypothetical protein ACD_63C00068G0001 [uncultured bacterium]